MQALAFGGLTTKLANVHVFGCHVKNSFSWFIELLEQWIIGGENSKKSHVWIWTPKDLVWVLVWKSRTLITRTSRLDLLIFIFAGLTYKDEARNNSNPRTSLFLQMFQLWGSWLFWHRLCWRYLMRIFMEIDSNSLSRTPALSWVEYKRNSGADWLVTVSGHTRSTALMLSFEKEEPVIAFLLAYACRRSVDISVLVYSLLWTWRKYEENGVH